MKTKLIGVLAWLLGLVSYTLKNPQFVDQVKALQAGDVVALLKSLTPEQRTEIAKTVIATVSVSVVDSDNRAAQQDLEKVADTIKKAIRFAPL